MKNTQAIILTLLIFAAAGTTQTRWKRAEPASTELQLLHSMHAASLPTAETMKKGNWAFEISHRFSSTIDEGSQVFWGFDGPANIRLALGYGVSNKLYVLVGRTNVNDNIELVAKYKGPEWRNKPMPVLLSVRGGVAYNGEVFAPVENESRLYQFYVQAIANTMWQKKLGIGVVPTYLHNAYIFGSDVEYSFTLGSYAQYYVSPRLSFFVEWNPTIDGWQQDYNSLALGLELETGGHFFKVFLSNNDRVNTSQFIVVANKRVSDGEFRFGFLITRTF